MSVPSEGKAVIWLELSRKFHSNLSLALTQEAKLVSRAEIQARAIPVVARILSEEQGLTDWQRDALCMFDEIFADITCSIYLGACGLDKPAQAILRRALEVGAATVYLWDLPQVFWGWKEHDRDLNFNEMLEHFSNPGFISSVKRQNPTFAKMEMMDASLARSLYRNLSNIVHGKMKSFESLLPDKFQHNQDDWRLHLERVCNVERVLLELWNDRFASVSKRLNSELPQLWMKETENHEPTG